MIMPLVGGKEDNLAYRYSHEMVMSACWLVDWRSCHGQKHYICLRLDCIFYVYIPMAIDHWKQPMMYSTTTGSASMYRVGIFLNLWYAMQCFLGGVNNPHIEGETLVT